MFSHSPGTAVRGFAGSARTAPTACEVCGNWQSTGAVHPKEKKPSTDLQLACLRLSCRNFHGNDQAAHVAKATGANSNGASILWGKGAQRPHGDW